MYARNDSMLDAGGAVLFWILFGVAVWLLFFYFIAKEFSRIAAMKGHDDKRYFWWTFFLGFVGMLMVIALPNLKQETRQTASRPDRPAVQPDRQPVPQPISRPVSQPVHRNKSQQEIEYAILKNGGWKCVCGRVNIPSASFCTTCGKTRQAGDRRYQRL